MASARDSRMGGPSFQHVVKRTGRVCRPVPPSPGTKNLIVAVLFLVEEVVSGIRHKRLITEVR